MFGRQKQSQHWTSLTSRADAAVKLKIGTTDEMIARAAENFLNWNTTDISNSVQDVLEETCRRRSDGARKMVNDRQSLPQS